MKKFLHQVNSLIAVMSAGFIAVVIGFSSSIALIYQLLINLGGDANMVASWLLALGVSMGLLSILLSYYYRLPILIAWSTPGVAMLQNFGYQAPIKPILSLTGLCNILAAPFCGYALNLTAISASICMTEDENEDPKKRYWASIWAGVFYILLGLFAAYIMAWFALLPKTLTLALAGIALFGTITHSLQQSMNSEHKHINEAAVITLLITASPISLWGLIGGLAILLVNSKLIKNNATKKLDWIMCQTTSSDNYSRQVKYLCSKSKS